jgi:hypothetical protein
MRYNKIKLGRAEIGKDFVVVSNTQFKDIDYVYETVDHKVDTNLAVAVGLGTIMKNGTNEVFIYHPVGDEKLETLRLGIYRQLVDHDYVDRKLDDILNSNGGEFIIRNIVRADGVIDMLREVFSKQKGKPNNVMNFPKKDV